MASAQIPAPPNRTNPIPSFFEIYERYFGFIWASSRRLGVERESIDDVVQEIFIVIHQRLHTLEQPESIRSWIYGVIRRTVSHYHRARRSAQGMGELTIDADSLETHMPTPFELTEQNDQVKVLEALLAELPSFKREVFVLAEIEELTVPEIAQALEIPLNTAYSRLRGARKAFEEALARHNEKEKGGLS